jgi:hypothetical protein
MKPAICAFLTAIVAASLTLLFAYSGAETHLGPDDGEVRSFGYEIYLLSATPGAGTAAAPALGIAPSSVDFGVIPLVTTVQREFVISNTGAKGSTLTGSVQHTAGSGNIVVVSGGGTYSLRCRAEQNSSDRM